MHKDAVVFDLDGVIADSTHRHPLVPDWEEFYKGIPDDSPISPLAKLVDLFYFDMDYEVILLTARPESARKDTEKWLIYHDIPFSSLYMRPKGVEDAPMWKLEEVKKLRDDYIIHWIFEDSPKSIELLKSNNFPIIGIASGYYNNSLHNVGGE